MESFKSFGFSAEIAQGLAELGFSEPTPIQSQAIRFLLSSKKDLVALAQTGTGKTAAFALPILHQLKPDKAGAQAIILCPTRELCLQISQDIRGFARHLPGRRLVSVYGGERIDIQIRALRAGADIIIGTPGRVHDLVRRQVLKLDKIKWLVLDEADEMLDRGFKDDLDAILETTPATRQTMLFSATISPAVQAVARRYMGEAEKIRVGAANAGAEQVSHEYYVVGARDRFEALKRILDSLPGVYGILFCRTRHETQEIADKLKQAHYDAQALHGEIVQSARTKIMDSFKRKQIRLLVATDVAARGIDVSNLSHVINYNLPDQNEAYTHRSGRTGRAANRGVSILLLSPKEAYRIRELERIIGKKFERKRVPDGEEVYQRQLECLVAEIESSAAREEDGGHYPEIAARLAKISQESLIRYFLADKFRRFAAGRQDGRDLNADPEPRASQPPRAGFKARGGRPRKPGGNFYASRPRRSAPRGGRPAAGKKRYAR